MMASENGHVEVVRALVAAKADVDASDFPLASNALMKASENGHVEVVRALIAGGADVNALNAHDDSPLSLATKAGHQDVVDLLKSAGATK